MKRRFFCLIITLCCSFLLCACSNAIPDTPFKDLDGRPDAETVFEKYGTDCKTRDGTSNTYAGDLIYDNYEWLGYEGKLTIGFMLTRERDSHGDYKNDVLKVREAEWYISSEDEAEIKALEKTIVDYFDKNIGNYEPREIWSTLDYGNWYDKHHNRYTLWQVTQWGRSSITVKFG